MYPSTIRLAGLLTLVLAFAGCASTNVSSYVARGVDLRAHRTYNWAPAEARPTGDPRLDNNRFFEERVQTAIEKELASRGFEKTASPHVLVRYHAGMTQKVYVSGAGFSGECEECLPEVYDEGTLLVDLFDADTNRLLWRGWAKGSIDGVIDDQRWMEQRIDEAVARIMRELPNGL
jgi:hypothetical protein